MVRVVFVPFRFFYLIFSNFLEFQLIYNNINTCYSINLKASSIEEKHTWKKLLTQRIQQTQK